MTLKGAIQAIPLKKDSLEALRVYIVKTIVHCPTGMSNFPLRQKQPPSLFPKKSGMRGFLEFPVRFFKLHHFYTTRIFSVENSPSIGLFSKEEV